VLLFERGEFSRADAALTGVLIRFMAPDILLGRLVSITQTLFYANMDMRNATHKHRNLYGFTYRTCDRPRWLAWSGRHSDSSMSSFAQHCYLYDREVAKQIRPRRVGVRCETSHFVSPPPAQWGGRICCRS